MTSIEPELWVRRADEAVDWYVRAFGAEVLIRVGEGAEIVARLALGEARFWVSAAASDGPRLDPQALRGTTGRTLLVVDDPSAVHERAVAAGASSLAPVSDEHGWRLGRIEDPFGHEWEIGRPAGQE